MISTNDQHKCVGLLQSQHSKDRLHDAKGQLCDGQDKADRGISYSRVICDRCDHRSVIGTDFCAYGMDQACSRSHQDQLKVNEVFIS